MNGRTAAGARVATRARKTGETEVRVRVDLDGTGTARISSGIRFFDHMLDQLARHGLFDIDVEATGDIDVDAHHTVEDVGICLGSAFNEALGERLGIVRMADRTVPLDEALVQVVVDVSGRPYGAIDLHFHGERVGSLPAEMIEHFLISFATEARITLHVRELAGRNDHHRAEATFKALARALADAVALDPRRAGIIPSTKGTLTA